MASPIVVSCPQCQKQIKAPAELAGKKIRCKGCGNTFAVQAAASPARQPAEEAEDDSNPYGVSEDEATIPRCPFCAKEMESMEAVVCLHCGYNTRTRQRLEQKTIIETTSGDRLTWLMPGILCVVGIGVLLVLDILYAVWDPALNSSMDWLAYKGFKVWAIIVSLFFMFFLGRFAVKRLIFNSVPPEKPK